MKTLLVNVCVTALAVGLGSLATATTPPTKRALPPLEPPACKAIAKEAVKFPEDTTTKTTQYFTPVFLPGPDGGLRMEDRSNCLEMEGACIVGNYLYTTGSDEGVRYERDKVPFIFGVGSGKSAFNRTNALFPCRTLAADVTFYRTGTVIYIPAFIGKLCPQNGQPVDGCFIVGDVGSAIKGQGRFDLFTGECTQYDGTTHSCLDPMNPTFDVPRNTKFRVLPPEAPLATSLRSQVDTFIENGWK